MNKENIFICALILSIVAMSVSSLHADMKFNFQKTTVIDEDKNWLNDEGVEEVEPNMAVDSNGDIYITYGNGSQYNYFYLQKSTDGGKTFSKQIIERDHAVVWDPVIAIDAVDNIYIVFNEEFEGNKYPETMSSGEVKIMKSADGGKNFSEPTIVAPLELLNTITGIKIDSNGYVYIFLKKTIIYVSKDGGKTFSEVCAYDGQDVKPINATLFSKTMYSVDNKEFRVAWFDNRNHELKKDNDMLVDPSVMDLFYAKLQENGEFSKNIKICTIDQDVYKMALYSESHTLLKKHNGNLMIYFGKWYVESIDNGQNWSLPKEVVINDIYYRGTLDQQHFSINENEIWMFSNSTPSVQNLFWTLLRSTDGGTTVNDYQFVVNIKSDQNHTSSLRCMDRVWTNNLLYIVWKIELTYMDFDKDINETTSQICFTKGVLSDDLDNNGDDTETHSTTSQENDSGGSCFIGRLLLSK